MPAGRRRRRGSTTAAPARSTHAVAAGVRPSWAWSTRLTIAAPIAATEAVSGLGDQHDHGQFVEQLERADRPLARLLAVRAGRLP